MSDKPILFSADMVRAILAGRKTVTRREVKGAKPPCAVGDTLWVREAWRLPLGFDALSGGVIVPDPDDGFVPIWYEADTSSSREFNGVWGRYRHARFMPRWASRISLRVVNVRAERLQDMTEGDAAAEGIFSMPEDFKQQCARTAAVAGMPCSTARWQFTALWDSLHGPGAWDANPTVWRIRFERIEA